MTISKSKKICIITGSRAEYGLLKNLILRLKKNKKFKIKLIVTGSHLSEKYGFTLREIKKDSLNIENKINLNFKKDNTIGISNSISLGLNKFVKIFEKLKPDLILVLGDRFEIYTSALAALLCRLPICHIHGGELTEAMLDDAFRHSITKMSHIHFAANQIYKKRIIQLGENPKNVFNVGGLGVDSIKKQKNLKKIGAREIFKFKFFKKKYFGHISLRNFKSKKYKKILMNY